MSYGEYGETMVNDAVEVFTDGACLGNPGPGGWAAVLRCCDGATRELYGGEAETTNNRMELLAAISALRALETSSEVKLYTDSAYLQKGITDWIRVWKQNGWKTANKRQVKNLDLWLQLDSLCGHHRITWCWLKGHAGHEYNERADLLARQGARAWRGSV